MKENNWIKTSEKLPGFNSFVLCYCPIYGRYIGSYDRIEGNFGIWSDYKESGILPPTHWQPLPDIPE